MHADIILLNYVILFVEGKDFHICLFDELGLM